MCLLIIFPWIMRRYPTTEHYPKDRNTWDHLVRTAGNGDTHARGVSHTGYLAHGNSKGEAKGK